MSTNRRADLFTHVSGNGRLPGPVVSGIADGAGR
jgi:hypothetical protein